MRPNESKTIVTMGLKYYVRHEGDRLFLSSCKLLVLVFNSRHLLAPLVPKGTKCVFFLFPPILKGRKCFFFLFAPILSTSFQGEKTCVCFFALIISTVL